jgi:hypothetical protein
VIVKGLEPVRADRWKFLELRVALVLAVGLHELDAPDVLAGIAAVVEIHRHFVVERVPHIDDVGWDIAEQQIAGLGARHPKRAFGEAEARFHQFKLGVRRDQRIKSRIEPPDRHGGLLRVREP